MPLPRLPERFAAWWFYKTPGVLSVLYAALLLAPVPELPARLGFFLLSFGGIATYGYLLNDWFDRDMDAAAGKANRLAATPPARFWCYAALALLAGLAPWTQLPATAFTLGLLGAEVLLLTAYSFPGLRLKSRGWPGTVADALYASVLPFLIAAGLFCAFDPSLLQGALLVTWLAAQGLRNILLHQLQDAAHDAASGERTTVLRYGAARTRRLIRRILFPIETGAFLTLLFTLPLPFPLLPPVYLGYALYIYYRELYHLRRNGLAQRPHYHFLGGLQNEFYEKWLPVLLLIGIAVQQPRHAWLLPLHAVLFYRQTLLLGQDARLLLVFAARRAKRTFGFK